MSYAYRLSRLVCILLVSAAVTCLAQVPTGGINGTVTDESGAVIPGAVVTVTNKATGFARSLITGQDGTYNATLLSAGAYEVKTSARGFRVLVRPATVETGNTTTVNMSLEVGSTTDVVTVQAEAAMITYDSHTIDGVVTRQQIENLPLNGRSFLQLAFLQPGVTVATGSTSQYNNQFNVSVLGGDSNKTAVTVDGGNVRNAIEGQIQQNFSQEIVQEFQISTVNFDLSTPITSVGAVNIVTRSGGNDLHGSGYFFFRDHNMSAYPGLGRDPLAPDPFFARRQSGFWVGGPIKKDRAFFFTNLEHNNQKGVFAVHPNSAYFADMTQIAPSPYIGTQFSQRFDFRLTPKHTLFLRYSHDGNNAVGPNGSTPTMPSNWLVNTNWADQSVLGFTSVISPSLVNDFRFSYAYWQNRNLFPTRSQCPGDCIGLGFPEIDVVGTNVSFGNTSNATQGRDLRRFTWADNMTWQHGTHQLRYGGEVAHEPGTGFWGFADPAIAYVYSPEIVSFVNSKLPASNRIPIPSSFHTIQDVLQLPLAVAYFGIGDPSQPPPFQIGNAKTNNRLHLYLQDTWRIKPRFTLNYGLAWEYEDNLVNHDLDKPQYLAPLFGPNGLAPTKQRPYNFMPSVGFAWNVSRDSRTVIRAGAGIYYDTELLWRRLQERSSIGPVGNGRVPVPSSYVPNPLPGIPGVALGAPIDFESVPSMFTLGNLMSILTPVRAGLEQAIANPNPNDLSVRNIEVLKSGTRLYPSDYPVQYSEQLSIGVQREVRGDLVVSADFISRQFIHTLLGDIDYNHWNSVNGPVIPKCTGAQSANPKAECSGGPITVWTPGGRGNYRALLVRVDKRYAQRYEFTGSYALAAAHGVNGIVDLTNWFASYGPQSARHTFNFSGIVDLPWGFQASFISEIATKGPVMPYINNVDLNGNGLSNLPIPGAAYNSFGRGLGKSDLQRLVDQFNQNYAGKTTSRGQKIPSITLPRNYNFGDNFYSQDLRLSKIFKYRERYKLAVFAEAFNLLNIANLQGYDFNLANPAGFGQPQSRIGQVFGSGGPRAFQLGARVNF